MLFCIYLVFTFSIEYIVSNDQKRLEVNGKNEILTQDNYRGSGTYTTYTHATINDGIVGLGNGCFEDSSNLIEIKLSSSIKTIGSNCFKGCNKIISLAIPEGVENLLSNTFFDCFNLLNISLPSSLKSIAGAHIFHNTASLKVILVADQVIFSTDSRNTIVIENGNIAVVGAGGNSQIIIPSCIEIIKNCFLNSCPKLTSVIFEPGSKLKQILGEAFRMTSITELIIPNGTLILNGAICFGSKITKLCFPKTIIEVSSNVFEGIQLQEIIIEDGCKGFHVTETGVILNGNQSALLFIPQGTTSYNISSLTTALSYPMIRSTSLVNISVENLNPEYSDFDNVLYSKNKATLYANSGGNKHVKVHKDCTTIYQLAFASTLIETIEFLGPNSVTRINFQAFQNTANLKVIDLPDSVSSINSWCFTGSGVVSLHVPASLKSFGENPFTSATNLLELDFSKCLEIKSFPPSAIKQCSKLNSVTLPPNLVSLSNNLFSQCVSLESITITPNVEIIGEEAFSNSGLKKIIFASGSKLKEIGNECFMKTKLVSIEFPQSVWLIGFKALSNCPNLVNVSFAGISGLGSIREDILSGSHNVERIVFGANLSSISPGAVSQSDGLKWVEISQDNKWYTSHQGVIYNKAMTSLVGCPAGISTVIVPKSVTQVSERAFYMCHKLESISFEEGSELSSIGKSTFEGCSGLKVVAFPSMLSEIGSGAFIRCENLHTVVFPSKLGTIGSSSFQSCTKLANITFPISAQLGKIEEDAFNGCSSLKTVELPNSLKVISMRGFYGCGNLRYVGLPFEVVSIGQLAFGECRMLEFVSVCRDSDVADGSSVAFSNCHAMLRIIVTNTYIGDTFCGKPVFPVLDRDCRFPSERFTIGNLGTGQSILKILLQSSITQWDDDSNCIE